MGSFSRSRMFCRLFAAIFVCLLAIPTGCLLGQGILLPEDPHFRLPRPTHQPVDGSYRIRELSVDASIKNQVAVTQVTQMFENTGNRQIEASFVFPLPYDGAVNQMTFMIDGKEYEAKLLKADEARRIYEGYVRRNQDPALLEWIGTGMFRSSVFPIPAGATRTVTLEYSQLLRKDQRLTDYLFPLSTARYTTSPIEKISLRVAVDSAEKLRSIYSPTHNVDISRDDDYHAVVRHSSSQSIPHNDFRLVFDSSEGKVASSLISCWPEGEDQGYFVLLASPELNPAAQDAIRKTVIFVVDQSGSMSGEKIEQAREAAKFVINNLKKDDLFNIVSYESTVNPMKPELQRFSDESRQEAIGFINSINSGGSTNINEALKTALGLINTQGQPAYMVFLTDGLPTVGETNELKIAENCKLANRYGARMISFGVGYDVNSRLLDRLSRENHGQSEYVRPDEDIEASVARLYGKISSPVLSDMIVKFEFDTTTASTGETVNRVYPKGVTDMFAGSQIVMIGRYREAGPVTIKIAGKVGDKDENFRFDLNLAKKGEGKDYAFVPSLWAARRIGEIIDLLDLQGQNSELINELVELSTKHGIVTPYTSFLADENSALAGLADKRGRRSATTENLSFLQSESGGESGFAQRSSKQAFKIADNMQQADSAGAGIQLGAPGQMAGGMGGRGGGGLGGMPANNAGGSGGSAGGSSAGQTLGPAVGNGQQGVRKVGTVTLYVRGETIVADNAVDVDLEKEKDSITELARFSDGYFNLVADNTASENLILAEQRDGETLVVKLRNKTYRIK